MEKGFLGEKMRITDANGGESDFSDREVVGQIDFSNPEAVSWYQDKLRQLLTMGAEAIKTDFGETIQMQTRYAGMEAKTLRNLYALLYQQAAAEVTQSVRGHSLIWARAGWAGCQRYPVHWGGDCASTWEGIAASLKGGLQLGLSGFAAWSHDVPGFHGLPDFMNSRPTPLLYLRWTQFGCLSSHFRYHGTSEREPWFYPEVADFVKAWWRLRYALIPYIEAEFEALRHTGRPFLAALCFEDPEDSMAWKCDDQYMAGRDLLVAPVMNESGRRSVWLPKGNWVDFWTGDVFSGRQWLPSIVHPPERLPLFVRQGSRLPVCATPVLHTGEIAPSSMQEIHFDTSYTGPKKSPLADLVRELLDGL
jgi:alpha-D-xyloside xylohydrolase